MSDQNDSWMSHQCVCPVCEVVQPPPKNLRKELWGSIMCKRCLDKAKDAITAYVEGDAPIETLAKIRITKGEMLKRDTVLFFARNYPHLKGHEKFRKWFTDNTIGAEKYAEELAVDAFIRWVVREYNAMNEKPEPTPKAVPAGMTGKLGEIAKVTIENPPKPQPDIVITEAEVDAEAAVADPQPSEKEKKAQRRKRSETQDAPATPGAEVTISAKPTPKASAKKITSQSDKLRDKISKRSDKLRDKIEKDKEKLRK